MEKKVDTLCKVVDHKMERSNGLLQFVDLIGAARPVTKVYLLEAFIFNGENTNSFYKTRTTKYCSNNLMCLKHA